MAGARIDLGGRTRRRTVRAVNIGVERLERGAAAIAADQLRPHELFAEAKLRGFSAHERSEPPHVLSQAAEHEVGTILSPGRPRLDDVVAGRFVAIRRL